MISNQSNITGYVFDAQTKEPLFGTHIYFSPSQGVISNNDGLFSIISRVKKDTLTFSHTGYHAKEYHVADLPDTIFMEHKPVMLSEVEIVADEKTILEKVIDAMEKNHYLPHAHYEIFVRKVLFRKDSSSIHYITEGSLQHYLKKNKSHFKVNQMKLEAFTKFGKKQLKDYRTIFMIATRWDYLFVAKWPFLNKKKLKQFDVKIVHFDSINEEIRLEIKPNKKDEPERAVLRISSNDYAIKEIIIHYNDTDHKKVTFQKFSDKWLPVYSVRQYNRVDDVPQNVIIRIAKYNYLGNKAPNNLNEYQGLLLSIAEPAEQYIPTDKNEPFWAKYNYFPLDQWIETVLERQKKDEL